MGRSPVDRSEGIPNKIPLAPGSSQFSGRSAEFHFTTWEMNSLRRYMQLKPVKVNLNAGAITFQASTSMESKLDIVRDD